MPSFFGCKILHSLSYCTSVKLAILPICLTLKMVNRIVRSSKSNCHLSAIQGISITSFAATSVQPAPYDPRVISSDPRVISSDPRAISSPLSSVPPLLDSRASNQEMKKPAIPLPKLTPAPRLTPAPGYAPKCHENGKELPSGEAVDF